MDDTASTVTALSARKFSPPPAVTSSPLTVNYQERTYAAFRSHPGKASSVKAVREGEKPGSRARRDRPVRPLSVPGRLR